MFSNKLINPSVSKLASELVLHDAKQITFPMTGYFQRVKASLSRESAKATG